MKTLIGLLLLGSATPALAQHAGHTMPSQPAPQTNEQDEEESAEEADASEDDQGMDHSSMDHSQMDQDAMQGMDHTQMAPGAMNQGSIQGMDHEAMDHEAMDHSSMESAPAGGQDQMDHSAMGHGAMEMSIPEVPPPPAAGSGPPRAADAIWGTDAMQASREELRRNQGGAELFRVFWRSF